MKKIALLISAVILLSVSGLAQEGVHYGVFLGGSVNWMNIGNNLYYDDSEVNTVTLPGGGYEVSYLTVNNAMVNPNYGFTIGGMFEYEANDWFGAQFDLLFNQYGYALEGQVSKKNIGDDEFITYKYNSSTMLSNFSAAIMAKFYFFEKQMSVDLGVQPSFCIRMIKETERGIIHKSVVYDSDKEFNPLNISGIAGITVNMLDNLFCTVRYNMGFMDLIKAKTPYLPSGVNEGDDILYKYDSATSKTHSVVITVGYKIK